MAILGAIGTGASIAITIRAIDEFSKTFNNAVSGTQRLQSALKLGVASVVAMSVAVAGLGVSAAKTAIDFVETQSKFDTVFKDIREEADKTAKNLQDNFGLSQRASKQLLSDTGDLLTGFGFAQDEALKLSTQVNELAVDLASFTNYSGGAEGASKALTKALLGEREMLKSLGIAILEEDVKRKAVALGIAEYKEGTKTLTRELTRQEKAYVTLALAQEQSKNAIGDFARTQDSAANQMRIFAARIDDLKLELGQALMPVVNEFIGVLVNDLIPVLKPLIPVLGDAMVTAMKSLIPSFREIIPAVAELIKTLTPLIPNLGEIIASSITLASTLITELIPAIEGILPAVQGLADILVYIINILQEIIKWVRDVINWFNKLTKTIADDLRWFKGGLGKGIAEDINKMSNIGIISPGKTLAQAATSQTGGTVVRITGNIYGINSRDISKALSKELANKISL